MEMAKARRREPEDNKDAATILQRDGNSMIFNNPVSPLYTRLLLQIQPSQLISCDGHSEE